MFPRIHKDFKEKSSIPQGLPCGCSFENELLTVFMLQRRTKKLFGLLNERQKLISVLDRQGVIKLTAENPVTRLIFAGKMKEKLPAIIEENTLYDESGQSMPDVYLIVGGKIVDFSGLETADQIVSLTMLEIEGLEADYKIYVILKKRGKG